MKKILLIEDDPYILKMYQLKLDLDGFQPLIADEGRAGLEMAQKENPDLIVLDILMPEIDGFEVLEKLKKDPQTKDIPVIILSNLGQQEGIKRGLDLGAVDYILKTDFTPNQVVAKIKEVLGMK